MKSRFVLVVAVFSILLLCATNSHNLYAIFWKAENATVTLANCDGDCELKGTLSVIPFDGRYQIQTMDKTVVLDHDSISMISYSHETR